MNRLNRSRLCSSFLLREQEGGVGAGGNLGDTSSMVKKDREGNIVDRRRERKAFSVIGFFTNAWTGARTESVTSQTRLTCRA